MDVDVAKLIGAVTREITTREYQGKPARVLVATRSYDTTIDDLWDALTNAERIPRWFLPISGELRLGGHYQLEGNAGGEITTCEPPRKLGLTWGMHGQLSWVEVQLSSRSRDNTLLRLEHIAHVPDEIWRQFGPGGVGVGWEQGLMGLDLHFSTETAFSPEAAPAWLSTPEGRDFVHKSSDGWCQASIAAGADPAEARAAAERTTKVYTGDA